MKERPILFSGPMVRAILEGRKTQTRRVVKGPENIEKFYHQNENRISFMRDGIGWCCSEAEFAKQCPFGVPGDRLWVKETFWMHSDPEAFGPDVGNVIDSSGRRRIVGYAASMDADSERCANDYGAKKRPSIHMPRWASRITLEVNGVRAERLQDISEKDAKAEGVVFQDYHKDIGRGWVSSDGSVLYDTAKRAFQCLWESINGEQSWAANPWVWVVDFNRV